MPNKKQKWEDDVTETLQFLVESYEEIQRGYENICTSIQAISEGLMLHKQCIEDLDKVLAYLKTVVFTELSNTAPGKQHRH